LIGLDQYLAFLGVSALVICTPGQDTALTVRNTLLAGRSGGAATALGVCMGNTIWTLATSAGLAIILVASGPLFLAVRLAGAAYLIYLGVLSLMKAASRVEGTVEHATGTDAGLSSAAAFWQGLVSNLSNAKMVAFFISLLPPFAGPHPTFVVLLALGLNFSMLTLAWLAGYAFAVHRLRRMLTRPSIRRGLDTVLGAVLVGLGLRLAREGI
jgi:threonine/homoserine/homoserine lactone efflux protein